MRVRTVPPSLPFTTPPFGRRRWQRDRAERLSCKSPLLLSYPPSFRLFRLFRLWYLISSLKNSIEIQHRKLHFNWRPLVLLNFNSKEYMDFKMQYLCKFTSRKHLHQFENCLSTLHFVCLVWCAWWRHLAIVSRSVQLKKIYINYVKFRFK